MNTLFTTFTEMTCYSCTVHFGVTGELYGNRKRDGRSFWCPNGHEQAFIETEATRLQKKNKTLLDQRNYAEMMRKRAEDEAATAKKQKAAIKGQLTKTRNRIAHGVCPCCHRTFKQLAAHMTNKHPDFKEAVS